MEKGMKISLKITTSEVAEMLSVSSATVLNWVKTGLLTRGKDKLFNTNEVLALKKKIASGEISRLSSRANKKKSDTQFLPFESIMNKKDISKIVKIIDEVKKFDLNIEETLFVLAINLLMKQDIISKNVIKDSFYFNNDNFRDEIRNWISVLNPDSIFKELVYDIDMGEFSEDILGVFYQYFLTEGDKNKKGSYFTPAKIVKELVENTLDRIPSNNINSLKILDPCCGTGKFLLGISDYFIEKWNTTSHNTVNIHSFDPKIIWGFDNDKIAVRIARINLMLKFKGIIDFSPNIFHMDYLIDKFNFTRRVRFDAIMTNPPWGVKYSSEDKILLSEKFPELKSKESFSLFIVKSLQMLKSDGFLSFLLPESLLNIKVHRDIRKYILGNSNLLSITKYGKLFRGVFTDVISLELRKLDATTDKDFNKVNRNEIDLTESKFDLKKSEINQNRFISNKDFIFDTDLTDIDEIIIAKIFSQRHKTLENKAKWALGIVTGDNKRYISIRKVDKFDNRSSKRVVTGKEIRKFFIYDNSPSFLNIDEIDNFQQVAPLDIYETKEKLLYKFISNKLTFAYDNRSLLTLNSANILIPKIPKVSIKVILALLNSSLYQYIFKKKFNSLKVLKGNLEKLPIPIWSKEKQQKIKNLVDILIQKGIFEEYRNEIYKELDNLIFKFFKLTKKDIDIVKNS